VNAILYATSAHLAPILIGPARRVSGQVASTRRHARAVGGLSSDHVFYLPGHIDISRLRRFQDLGRSEGGRTLMKRFMVRGHWRRANRAWKDPRLRWIEPYWKGPDIATVIERDYRLKP